jgi:cell division septal protein FtsQ
MIVRPTSSARSGGRSSLGRWSSLGSHARSQPSGSVTSTSLRRWSRTRSWWWWAPVAALLPVALAAATVRPELWLVRRVVVEGEHVASEAAVRHLANLRNGTPIWRVYTPGVAAQVAAHPWIRSVHVDREWPDTVRIEVQEHQVAAVLHQRGQLVYVDRQGVPFLAAAAGDLDYPHLTGFDEYTYVDATTSAPPSRYNHPDLVPAAIRAALLLVDLLDQRGLVARRDVSEIGFRPTTGFTVHAGPARVLFAADRFAPQLDRLEALVAAGVDLTSPVEVDLAPVTVAIVRPLPPLSPAVEEPERPLGVGG